MAGAVDPVVDDTETIQGDHPNVVQFDTPARPREGRRPKPKHLPAASRRYPAYCTSSRITKARVLCWARDWVFANDTGQPRWQESILQRRLKPAGVRAGVGKIGWHTFRHTYSTMLRSVGTDIKVQQELLRHSTIQSTMNVYTQAVSEQKREANSKVVEMMFLHSSDSGQILKKESQ